MVDTESLLNFFGSPAGDKSLIDYMSKNNISLSSELSLNDDEYRAYIERPDDGFCLIFTDETYFLGKGNQEIGSGEIFFSGVFFYAEGKDGYSQYKKNLPYNISFNDTREDVVRNLGEQSWQRLAKDGKRIIADRWDNLPNVPYQLHITYDKDSGRVRIVSASMPDKPIID